MTAERLLGALGTAAVSARRMGLGRPLALMDAGDFLLLRAHAPLLKASSGQLELRGYFRHRGFVDYVARGMREERYYQSLVVAAVDSRTTFVDAGAHFGVYTLLACRRARRVVAFEPDPYNLRHFAAMCDEAAAKTSRFDRKPSPNEPTTRNSSFRSTFSSSLTPREVDAYRTLRVETISVDHALDDSDLESLVVKLDVEGAEPRALAGRSTSIRRADRLAVFAEVNPEALQAGGSSAERLIDDLLAAGLSCAWIDEDEGAVVPLHEGRRFTKGNLVCVKRANG